MQNMVYGMFFLGYKMCAVFFVHLR